MRRLVFLDTGVLGIVTHPRGSEEATECTAWLLDLLRAGIRVCVPEVCDYELRREYILNGASRALSNLDDLNAKVFYVPINTEAMKRAADLWAEARKRGRPTAPDHALDGDVILCAQALLGAGADEVPVVATTNVAHLADFVTASLWRQIRP